MFMVGALPALLAFYLNYKVDESPAWLASRTSDFAGQSLKRPPTDWRALLRYLPVFLFLVVLMFAFTSFSHGTQDLYPTFLHDHGLSPSLIGLVAAIGNLGALTGGMCCGAISEKFGRRRTIVLAALLAIPMIPLWAWSHSAVMLAAGGFLMQFMVQGAWGIIPAHLNELSPAPVRAILPGVAYQLGNLLSSRNSIFQQAYATATTPARSTSRSPAPSSSSPSLVAAITALGPEAKGANLTGASQEPRPS
jgi:SHS family lactate transporter-like MFS transporter